MLEEIKKRFFQVIRFHPRRGGKMVKKVLLVLLLIAAVLAFAIPIFGSVALMALGAIVK